MDYMNEGTVIRDVWTVDDPTIMASSAVTVTNPNTPMFVDPAVMASAVSTAGASGDSWLDAVPGARAAYNFIVGKLAQFHDIGLNRLPGYEALLTFLKQRVLASNDPALQALYADAQAGTQGMRAKWTELEPQVRDLAAKLTGNGLGVLPVATLLALAGTMVVLASGMYLFFNSDARNEDTIRQLVDRGVANGVITTNEAARLLRGGSMGSGLGSLGGGLALVALAAAAIYFLPRRRNA